MERGECSSNDLNMQGASMEIRYRGIRERKWGRWVSEVRVPNKRSRIWLGTYSTREAAARAYDTAVYYLRGTSGSFNFLEEVREREEREPLKGPYGITLTMIQERAQKAGVDLDFELSLCCKICGKITGHGVECKVMSKVNVRKEEEEKQDENEENNSNRHHFVVYDWSSQKAEGPLSSSSSLSSTTSIPSLNSTPLFPCGSPDHTLLLNSLYNPEKKIDTANCVPQPLLDSKRINMDSQ